MVDNVSNVCPEGSHGSGLYRLPELRVSMMESYPYTSCLHYVTLPCMSRIRPSILGYVGSGMLQWAFTVPIRSGTGPSGSGSLLLGWTSSIKDQQQLGRPAG